MRTLLTVKQGEILRVCCDFGREIDDDEEAIASVSLFINVLAGVDVQASSLIAGAAPSFTRCRVDLVVGAPLPGGFVPGASYELVVQVMTTLGQTLIQNHYLRAVSPTLPVTAQPPLSQRPDTATILLLMS